MARAESGRVVVDIDPALKRKLYSALAMDNSTLKDWFIQTASQYIEEQKSSEKQSSKKGSKP